MKKRILIPTDFSENAFNALRYAVGLFEQQECEFLILNSYYLSGMDSDNLLIPEPSKKERHEVAARANNNMERLQRRVASFEENKNHNFTFRAVFGPFFQTVKQVVEDNGIELVIMGTKGQSDKKTIILGSNAVNLMEKVRSCPIMAIPFDTHFQKPNEIVFPTGFKAKYKADELHMLAEISNITEAPIRVLHIQNKNELSAEQQKNKDRLTTVLGPAEVSFHKLYDMDVNVGVRAFVLSRESEMIALINRKHNFFGSIFSNPLVKELGMHAKVPLLAMHDIQD